MFHCEFRLTNQYGLVNLNIGTGTVVSGTFNSISWGTNQYFLKIDMDPAGGTSYTEMGIQQLVSVPYALNAKNASTADMVANSDNDTTNEIQMLSKSGADVTLSKGGGTVSVADDDSDTTNEIQMISLVGTNLTLSKSGGTADLSSLGSWTVSGTSIYYNTGNVGVGTSSPAHKLHVTGSGDTAVAYFYNGSSGGSAVKGSSSNGPTNGYLGIQSSIGFDNNAAIRFPNGAGMEVGILGVSTGTSTPDNIGVMGLTNGGYPGYFKNTGTGNQVGLATNGYGVAIDTGKLGVNDYIEHLGDINTQVRFIDDRILFHSGGVLMLDLLEGANDFSVLGSAGVNGGIGGASSNTRFTANSSNSEDNAYAIYAWNTTDADISNEGSFFAATSTGAFNQTTRGLYAYSNDGNTGTGTRFAYGSFNRADVASALGASRSYGLYTTYAGNADIQYSAYFGGGTFCTGSYFIPSDENLKKNVSPLTTSLDKIMTLPVKTYDYKTSELSHMNLPEGKQTGIMAQDLEKAYPELVSQTAQPALDSLEQKAMTSRGEIIPEAGKQELVFKGVNYTGLVPHLVKATQEQQAIIEAQKKDMEALKLQLAAQQKLLLELQAQMAKTKN